MCVCVRAHAPCPDDTPPYLDVVLVERLVQVVEVDVPVERVGHGVLDQALDLSAAEVLGDGGELLQVDPLLEERVGSHLQVGGEGERREENRKGGDS